jgi:C-terminal processing protease CtpA/Prc
MLWLEPSRHFGDGFIFDMSGLDLQWRRLQREIEVMHVFDGTPAAEVGLRTGDRILNIDHQPVTAFDLAQIRRMFHEPRSYTVDFRRGSQEMSVVLRLRKLL